MNLLANLDQPDKPRLKGDDAGVPAAIGGLVAAIVERAKRVREEAAAVPRQLSLALEHAPDVMRRHGLRAAHPRPLVSLGKRPDKPVRSFRVAPARAWRAAAKARAPAPTLASTAASVSPGRPPVVAASREIARDVLQRGATWAAASSLWQ